MPWAVRPSAIRAAAAMIDPHSARMNAPSKERQESKTELPGTAAHNEQDARQNDEKTTATTTRPRAVWPLRIVIAATAEQRTSTHTHGTFSVKKGSPPRRHQRAGAMRC